jgi:hypothetical protein
MPLIYPLTSPPPPHLSHIYPFLTKFSATSITHPLSTAPRIPNHQPSNQIHPFIFGPSDHEGDKLMSTHNEALMIGLTRLAAGAASSPAFSSGYAL